MNIHRQSDSRPGFPEVAVALPGANWYEDDVHARERLRPRDYRREMKNLLVILGTKGQYVKMAPVLLEMDRRGIPYVLAHANQHPRITREISVSFGLRPPDMELLSLHRDIATKSEALIWLGGNLLRVLVGTFDRGGEKLHLRDFLARDALVVIHGDAPPALLSLILAERFRLRIAHVEAGERTYDLLQPFPEEIIRKLVDRHADLLFAGSPRAIENLRKERVRGEVIDIGMNTVLDAVRLALQNQRCKTPYKHGEYSLVCLHRFELLNSRDRLSFVVDLLEKELASERLVLTLHESTRRSLQRAGLLGRLAALRNLDILPLRPYHEFIHLLANARFLVTDGGGPQQESNILGVPCLVLRESVEQPDYSNVRISGFDLLKAREFLSRPDRLRIEEGIGRFDHIQPSKTVVDHLQKAL